MTAVALLVLAALLAAAAPAAAGDRTTPLAVGDTVPALELGDQHGQAFRLADATKYRALDALRTLAAPK